MNKLGSLCGSVEVSSNSISLDLKLTAEKLVQEQVSVKTHLDMATTKLKKSMEHIHSLEEKLQNENAKLKVKQKEDSKLWEGSDSKFSSSKTSTDQLAERLQYLACRVRDAEQDKNQLEDKLSESSKAFDCLDLQMKDLAVKLESAEDNYEKSKAELTELKVQKEEMEKRHTDESSRALSLIGGKEKLVKEQASLKTDLDMATTKLKKSMEHIHSLEEKLQNAINENAKLKVKQKEDSKLWEGSDSKFSSTKTSTDQLAAETLQHLACRVRDAEQDKNQLEDKLSESSKAFDCLDLQMKDLAVKLESAEDNYEKSKAELTELKVQKEMEKRHTDESSRALSLIGGKDALIKDLEGTAVDKLCFQSLNSRLEEVQHELSLKEDICKCLTAIQNNLEKEKSALQLSNDDFARRLLASGEEINGLEALVHELVEKLIELDKHGAKMSDNIVQLNHAFDTCYKLVQQEKDLTANRTQIQIARLDNQLLHVRSEKEAFQSGNDDLKNKVIELQSSHESFMAQHAEESRLAKEKVQKIESEAEVLVSKKTELELLVSQLEEKNIKLRRKINRRRKSENPPIMKALSYILYVVFSAIIASLAGFGKDGSVPSAPSYPLQPAKQKDGGGRKKTASITIRLG